jgi:hypothetical protein
VVFAQPLPQTQRKKKVLLRKIRPVNLRHIPRLSIFTRLFKPDTAQTRNYSDTLPGRDGSKISTERINSMQ